VPPPGGAGYIGSVIADRLLAAGHDIVGLARSDESADPLTAKGITPYRGDVSEPDTRVIAARAADGVIHTAFDTSSGDFSQANAGTRSTGSTHQPVDVASGVHAHDDRDAATATPHRRPQDPATLELDTARGFRHCLGTATVQSRCERASPVHSVTDGLHHGPDQLTPRAEKICS
jgi:NAD(P)-dependent dehydrogenase (short-subunit alcohol dehydrogenase family)